MAGCPVGLAGDDNAGAVSAAPLGAVAVSPNTTARITPRTTPSAMSTGTWWVVREWLPIVPRKWLGPPLGWIRRTLQWYRKCACQYDPNPRQARIALRPRCNRGVRHEPSCPMPTHRRYRLAGQSKAQTSNASTSVAARASSSWARNSTLDSTCAMTNSTSAGTSASVTRSSRGLRSNSA